MGDGNGEAFWNDMKRSMMYRGENGKEMSVLNTSASSSVVAMHVMPRDCGNAREKIQTGGSFKSYEIAASSLYVHTKELSFIDSSLPLSVVR